MCSIMFCIHNCAKNQVEYNKDRYYIQHVSSRHDIEIIENYDRMKYERLNYQITFDCKISHNHNTKAKTY